MLRLISILAMASCLPGCGSIAEHARPERLPIVDVHGHLQAAMSAEALLRLMDDAGVSTMVLQATRGPQRGTDAQALSYARRYPTRFVPFIGFQNRPAIAAPEIWTIPAPAALALLESVEQNLKTGAFRGLGEIVLRYHTHEGSTPNCCPEVDRPADSPLMHRIAELAERYQVPMIVHAEGEPKVVTSMERLIGSHPKATLIWAHNCGRQSAQAIRRLLAAHATLYCDLGGMTYTRTFGYGTIWPRSTPWIFPIEDGFGHLVPGMKHLFEQFPDRFMVGMDAYFTEAYQFYPERVRRFRELLSSLSVPTARKLAHENAERILKIVPKSKAPSSL